MQSIHHKHKYHHIPIDDLYFESLTVYETLKFAANLKLPPSLSKKERLQRVNTIIDELDLNKCRDTIIGSVGSGISGGERRRLAIGLEILNEPSLLLLDEPTSLSICALSMTLQMEIKPTFISTAVWTQPQL